MYQVVIFWLRENEAPCYRPDDIHLKFVFLETKNLFYVPHHFNIADSSILSLWSRLQWHVKSIQMSGCYYGKFTLSLNCVRLNGSIIIRFLKQAC